MEEFMTQGTTLFRTYAIRTDPPCRFACQQSAALRLVTSDGKKFEQ